MSLVWLRVAAVLYALASVVALPAVLYAYPRWRKFCVPLAGLAFLFHLVSATEMLGAAHRYFPVGYGEVESLLGLLIAGIFLLIPNQISTINNKKAPPLPPTLPFRRGFDAQTNRHRPLR